MRTLLIITVCLLGNVCTAQKKITYFELGGNGGFASLNYEWQFSNKPHLSLRAGLGVTFFEFEKDEVIEPVTGCVLCGINIGAPQVVPTVPISVQYLFNLQKSNYLETGLGSTWQLSKKSIFVFHASVGFRRYFGKEKNWMWKVNFTPILGVAGENAIKDSEPTVWGGVSIGKRF